MGNVVQRRWGRGRATQAPSCARRRCRAGIRFAAGENYSSRRALRGGGGWGPGEAYDFSTVDEGTCQTYRYGPHSALSIDASLAKLFECMTLAYSGRIMSPKWKTFKGLKLLQREKIRLNNAIWRAWHLQYVEKRKNPVCNFVTPLEAGDGEEHCKPEAGVMEGKYWKRHVQAVIRDHKWRMYSCAQVRTRGHTDSSCAPHQDNADMIQPTLGQLHPNFGENFMDTPDPLSGERPLRPPARWPGTTPGTVLPAPSLPLQGCSTPDPAAGILLAEKSSHPLSSASPSGTGTVGPASRGAGGG
nr:PREDICTED: MLX-interacting protein-like [Apteryx mantelli mantelli]